jgi:hypothetical protein
MTGINRELFETRRAKLMRFPGKPSPEKFHPS